ncbi:hypothetical protein PCANC_13139 [Puccinia coronata f. sp. avenae]|uniref:Golgi apparatus membrane protein TVP38 n=1 Tax=Puccinia coronata f. sp. avenae TaxID=200324 RepID=A0A2N5UWL4_9BASI|nr:hypothetical protein PCASD_25691 [Puccinia coronata f. sp. avenae]PLW07138.1 hypothetical protein PCANC_24854 [Puccinia coronata f. sp. avenae]PLW42026.1 hypothetical protein PCANC_13139 [Puccinia coronata f. sp. avenae]
MEPSSKPCGGVQHVDENNQHAQLSTSNPLPSSSTEPPLSLEAPSRPVSVLIDSLPENHHNSHPQPGFINPICCALPPGSPPTPLAFPSSDPSVQVDDPLAALSSTSIHPQLTTHTSMDSPPADAYRKEHIHLSSAHLPTHIGPTLTYRSSSSSPTVVGPSVEKLPISKPTHFTPSSSTTGHKLRLHQRFARAVRQEASECKEAALEIAHFIRHHDWKQTSKKAIQRKYWGWWLLLLVIIILSTLLSSYHTKVALYLKPYQAQIKNASWSWIIPTILLIIVSFPPLFGHELIILVAGMIWGLWIGFAIACAGTFLGEIMTYYAFKYLIGERSARVEAGSVTYASLAKLMREGGLGMVILVRASAMPGHVCTAMQATIGIGLWVFTVACVVTLPKQFALVYVGMLLGDPSLNPRDPLSVEASSKTDRETQAHHRISAAVFLLTAFFTILSAYIVWMRLRKIRPIVQQEFDARNKLTLNESPSLPDPLPEKPPQLADHPFYQNSTSECPPSA